MDPLKPKLSELTSESPPGKSNSIKDPVKEPKDPKEIKSPKFHRKGQLSLPDETRHKLAELTREYLNEELTEKGFKIRKAKILAVFANEASFCYISETKRKLPLLLTILDVI